MNKKIIIASVGVFFTLASVVGASYIGVFGDPNFRLNGTFQAGQLLKADDLNDMQDIMNEMVTSYNAVGQIKFDKVEGLQSSFDSMSGAINGRIDTLSGTVVSEIARVEGDVTALSGDVTALSGDITTLSGSVDSNLTNILSLSGSKLDKADTYSEDTYTLPQGDVVYQKKFVSTDATGMLPEEILPASAAGGGTISDYKSFQIERIRDIGPDESIVYFYNTKTNGYHTDAVCNDPAGAYKQTSISGNTMSSGRVYQSRVLPNYYGTLSFDWFCVSHRFNPTSVVCIKNEAKIIQQSFLRGKIYNPNNEIQSADFGITGQEYLNVNVKEENGSRYSISSSFKVGILGGIYGHTSYFGSDARTRQTLCYQTYQP